MSSSDLHVPSVTIGFLVYNGAPRMRRALDSLLAQTYGDFELVISDDASTDETSNISQEYARRDGRIRYIRQPKNLGQVGNFVFTATAARGKYFMWAHDDDVRDPECLAKLVEALDAHPACGVVMCSYQNVYEGGEIQNTVMLAGKFDCTNDGYYTVYKKMILNKPIHHFLHGLYRRTELLKFLTRPTPDAIRWDRIFMSEVALAMHFCSIPDLLFYKRVVRELLVDRYSKDPVGKAYLHSFAYTKYVWLLLWRPLSSSAIPIYRKLGIPFLWLYAFLIYKRKILFEVLHSGVHMGRIPND